MSRLLAILICASLTLSAVAQSRRSEGQPRSASVTVRVRLENGRPAPQNLQVQLLSANDVPIANAFTTDSGEASFGGVAAGYEYHLEVTGEGFEPAQSQFSIQLGEAMHSEFVTITEKKDDSPSAPGGSVSLFDLKVPGDARKELEKGDKFAAQKQWLEAAEHYQKAIDKYPNYVAAYNNLGAARINLNDAPGAKQAFQRAVDIDAKYATAWVNLARLSLLGHDPQTAEQEFQKATAIEPMNAQVLTLFAQTELELHRFADAEALARKVHALPHHGLAIVHVIGGSAYQNENRPAEAIAEYKIYLEEDPNGQLVAKVNEAIAGLQKTMATTP